MLGIPTQLAPRVHARSVVRAFHAAAVGSIVVAAAVLVVYQVADPSRHVFLLLVALAPVACVILLHSRFGSWGSAAGVLVVGGISGWWFARGTERVFGDIPDVSSFLVSLAIVPLLLVGGAGPVALPVIAWALLGFAVGRVATSLGTESVDGDVQSVGIAYWALIVVICMVGIGSRVTRRLRRLQPELVRSAREEHIAALRRDMEAEASALIHDTVLNDLNAVANAPVGPTDIRLARALDADLEALSRRDWFAGRGARASPAGEKGARGRLGAVVAESRRAGLQVQLSGDVSGIDRLEPAVASALLRAVSQCLVNVRKHAGTDHAEVTAITDGARCTVMVVDDGRGFEEHASRGDRMGLRNSVRNRVERIGGVARVWSTPGMGTSIMLSVPVRPVVARTGSDGVSAVGGPDMPRALSSGGGAHRVDERDQSSS